jgi:hypothetical protein
MDFTDGEYDMLIAKKIDKVVFYSKNNMVFTIDFDDLIRKRIEKDDSLKKQLLQHALKSDE